jgi:hypothetical protein
MAETCRALIVARTLMQRGVCIGALSEAGESLRLLSTDCGYYAADTPFQIGELWDISFERCPITPPHVEDIGLIAQTRVGVEPDVIGFILGRVEPCYGSINELFDGHIAFTYNGSGYISQSTGLPQGATGFWVPDSGLEREPSGNGHRYRPEGDYRHLKYVGVATPDTEIPAGQLVRVSLAKWWRPREADMSLEERCYVQLSGWFPL